MVMPDNVTPMDSVRTSNTPHHDLTTVEGLQSYINEHFPDYKGCDVHRLAGGTSGHVYRVQLGSGDSTIFKHTAKHIASNPNFALDPCRMDFEAGFSEKMLKQEGLAQLSEDGVPSYQSRPCCAMHGGSRVPVKETHAHLVGFKSYHQDVRLLNLEDAGPTNLKDAYSKLSKDDIQEIGSALGTWLAKLHVSTDKTYVSSTVPGRSNNAIGVAICRYSYQNLPAAATALGHGAEIGNRIDEEVGGLIQSDDESVCHGDFWPGNVLLRCDTPDKGPFALTVVDWEMVRIGCSATDVGQFAAEAFLLDHFWGQKGLRSAFLNAYTAVRMSNQATKPIDHVWMTRAVVHSAVHLAFWPARSAHWARGEDELALASVSTNGLLILQELLGEAPDPSGWSVFPFPETYDVEDYGKWLKRPRDGQQSNIQGRVRAEGDQAMER